MKFSKKFITAILSLAMLLSSLLSLASCSGEIVEGKDGLVPTVGENGNWWVGGVDTGFSAKGPQGDVGDKGESGIRGDKGVVGEVGSIGKPGNDGNNGVTPSYRINQISQKLEVSHDEGKSWTAIADMPTSSLALEFPVSSINPLPGTIGYELEMPVYITTADPYYGSVIDVKNSVYDSVILEKNKNGNPMVYTFLKDDLVFGQLPDYATGYDFVIEDDSQSVTLKIPEDAKYLYIYYCSPKPKSKELDMYLPSKITFTKPGATVVLDPLKNPDATEYDYPVHKITPLAGTIADINEHTKKKGGRYISVAEPYNGSIIKIEGTVFDTVTLKKNASGGTMGYAFLAGALELNQVPTYATGYSKVVWDESDEVTLKIPKNAKYLYVYYQDPGIICLPSSIKFTKSGEVSVSDPNTVRLATWNIGHFSGGANKDSSFTDNQFPLQNNRYSEYIDNVIGADVIALNEYSAMFTPSNAAKDTIFDSYDVSYEGPQRNYSCNAVFGKSSLISNIQLHEFECNKNAVITHTNLITAPDYYYITADLNVNGETVKLVMAHLAFDDNFWETEDDTVNRNQLLELIDVLEGEERVVLMGDWNLAKFSYLDAFIDEGYSLANIDPTLPTYNTNIRCIDNIIYKGVTVSNFTLAGTSLSDHFAIYCDITVNK